MTKTPLNKTHILDKALVKDLADLLNETSLTEIELSDGAFKIRVARQVGPAAHMIYTPPAGDGVPAASVGASSAPASSAPLPQDAVKSPMVGNVYLAPRPGADPFVKVGDTVEKGQTLLIIEAMKVMNPIPSPVRGVIKAIFVQDSQPVEYNEPLIHVA
jgi:acetyl-CoA carboxylase biotin carboxyl carrier protein